MVFPGQWYDSRSLSASTRWPCSRGDPFKGLLVALPPWSEPGAPDGGSTKRTIFPRRHLLLHILSVRMPLLGGSGFISESVHLFFFFLAAMPPPGFAAAPESLRTWAEIRVVLIGLVMSISGLVHLMKWAWSCQVTRSKQHKVFLSSPDQHLSWHVEYSILSNEIISPASHEAKVWLSTERSFGYPIHEVCVPFLSFSVPQAHLQ